MTHGLDRESVNEAVKLLVVRDVLLESFSFLERDLQSSIPGMEVDAGRLLYYIDGEKGELKNLIKKNNTIFSALEEKDREKVRKIVKSAYDFKIDAIAGLDQKKISSFTDRFMHALDMRRGSLVEITSIVCGDYDLDDNFYISISNHPLDILAKSSGQPWGWISSETIFGKFNKGIFSDVENGSAIAFLAGKATGITNARVMLRICFDNHVKGIGIESRIYYDDGKKGAQASIQSRKHVAKGVTAEKFYKGIVRILKENDLYNYKTCTTPFSYQGYSDTSMRVRAEITYKKKKIKNNDVDVKRTEGSSCHKVYK